jgi:HD-like signal output (HDOD) protein
MTCDLLRNERLEQYTLSVLADMELPMFSRLLIELLSLPLDDPKTARKLFELVGEDYALTCKVLRTANSFHFNRSNRPIENLSQAIFVLGVGHVRNLASTLVSFQTTGQSETLQPLMNRSMVSAQVAAVTAELDGLPREAPYLAAMLQNLGEVLVAHHSPMHYATILEQVAAGTAREFASVKEMGFTFNQLAGMVAHQWKLSPAICAIWDPRPSTSEVPVFARFANELTRVMCLEENRTGALALLAMRYGISVHLKADDMVDVWERALAETQEVFKELGVSFEFLSPEKEIAARTA